jgi:hypothetical protein
MHKPKAGKRVGLHYMSSPLDATRVFSTKFQNQRASWEGWAKEISFFWF